MQPVAEFWLMLVKNAQITSSRTVKKSSVISNNSFSNYLIKTTEMFMKMLMSHRSRRLMGPGFQAIKHNTQL